MKAGTILFNGADLALYGVPKFTIRRTPEPAAPAQATHRRVEIAVTVELAAEMPATVWARAEALQKLLATSSEGVLEIQNENGAGFTWQAIPGECSLPEAISRRGGRVEMSFTARESLAEGTRTGMTIDPMDGSTPVTISNVQDWAESVQISRADSRLAIRSEVNSNLSFSARTAYADPLLTLNARIAFLMQEAERIKLLGSKEARVDFSGFDQIVQFEKISAKPSPGWEWLEVEGQARYAKLPGDTKAEVEFKVESSLDPTTGETQIMVSGKIEAPDKATADAKAVAILTAWRTTGRRAMKIQKSDNWLEGEDGSTPQWAGMDFSYEFSEKITATSYTLKIDTHEGTDGRKVNYSGTVRGPTLAAVIATMTSVAGGKHPVEILSNVSVEYSTDDTATQYLVQASFTYEYATAALALRGNASMVSKRGAFGDYQMTVSGSISAASVAAARALCRGLIPAGIILQQDDETEEKSLSQSTSQFITLSFNYSWAAAHADTAVKYEESVITDYVSMIKETSISGTCYAAHKATAEASARALFAGMGLPLPIRESFTHSFEKAESNSKWLSVNFSFNFETKVTPDEGQNKISFNGTDLAIYGVPKFTIRKTPEPAAPAQATHRRVEISVTVELAAALPTVVWTRAVDIQKLLALTREGLLQIESETWWAKPGDCTLPEAISRRGGRIEMNFTARESLAGATGSGLTIQSSKGKSFIISEVQDWSESVRISRPDSRLAMRSEVGSTLAFTGRTAYADTLLPITKRIDFLMGVASEIEAINSKEVFLTFSKFSKSVQFESISAKPSAGWEWLEVEGQARYVTLPGDSEAEVEFKTDNILDPATGEKRLTVSGKIEAPDKATAEQKATEILNSWRDSGRAIKVQKSHNWLEGEDSITPQWAGMDFSYEFSKNSNPSLYTLKIDTHQGADGKKISYSGTVRGTTLADVTKTINMIAKGKHPVEIRRDVSVEYSTDEIGKMHLVQASFTYEYANVGLPLYGSMNMVTNKGLFGDHQVTVSGSISAPSAAQARSFARALIPIDTILRQDDETEEKVLYDNNNNFITLSFNYSWAVVHTQTAIKYDEAVVIDYSRMVKETSFSGTCYAKDRATAKVHARTLFNNMELGPPTRESFTNSFETYNSTEQWLSVNFSFSFETKLTGTIGHDIIEASFSLQRIGQVNHKPMTEIPLGYPVMQNPFGYNIGRMVASGSVKARVKESAKTWGQSKRKLAMIQGEEPPAEDPPDESIHEIYVPFNGKDVAFYEFSFQYGFRYAKGLTGVMP